MRTCFSRIALNIIALPFDVVFNNCVYVRRNRSVVSILSMCVRSCSCISKVPGSARAVLLTLLRMCRKLNGSAGLLMLLSTLWKNVLRLVLSMFRCVRVMQP